MSDDKFCLIDAKYIPKTISSVIGFFLFFFGLGMSKKLWLYSWEEPSSWGCSMCYYTGVNRLDPSDIIYLTPETPYSSLWFELCQSSEMFFVIVAMVGLLLIIVSALPPLNLRNVTYKVVETEETD